MANGTALAERQELKFTEEEIKALREVYAKEATDAQFIVFMSEAKRRGLMPGKQLYFRLQRVQEYDKTLGQKVWVQKPIHITGIDAFRLIAQRTGKYAGQRPAVWLYMNGENEVRRSDVPLNSKQPYAAQVSVLRSDFQEPLTAIARWDAYVQTYLDKDSGKQVPNPMWRKMGPEMILKCAEALALRKAFPEDLYGLYIHEEIPQDEVNGDTSPAELAASIPIIPQLPEASVPPATEPPSAEPTPRPASAGSNGSDDPDKPVAAATEEPSAPKGTNIERAGKYAREILLTKMRRPADTLRRYFCKCAKATAFKEIPEATVSSMLDLLDRVLMKRGSQGVADVIEDALKG